MKNLKSFIGASAALLVAFYGGESPRGDLLRG
jgi:hypothetical protein